MGQGGGISVAAPADPRRWSATFGSILICADESVELLDIAANVWQGTALDIAFRVRSVPAVARRPGPDLPWAPVGSMRGAVDPIVAAGRIRSGQVRPVADAVVDQRCSRDADASYTEVLVSLTVGRAGAWVDRLEIFYRAGDRSYRLPVEQAFVACGRAITDASVCDG